MGLLDWLTSDIGSSGATGIGGNPMSFAATPPAGPQMPSIPLPGGGMAGQGAPQGFAPPPQQPNSFNISPDTLQRGMRSLAGGLKTIKAGSSPFESFAQGLGGSISGSDAFDKDQLEKEVKLRTIDNAERNTDNTERATQGTIDYHNRTLSLQERKDKREEELLAAQNKAAADFATRMGTMLGVGGATPPNASPPASAAPPLPPGPSGPPPGAPGIPSGIPMSSASAPMPAAARPPLPPTAKSWGDDEAVAAGLYDAPKVAGATPPVQLETKTAQAPSNKTVDNVFKLGSQHIPVLVGALSNPNLPTAQKEVAKALLTEAFKNAKEPEKIETLRALSQNPELLDVEKQLRAAGKTEVNIDQKGETEFAKAAGGTVAKRFEKLSEEGQNATQDLALLGQLRDLGAVVKTGAPAAIQSWLAERGIKVGDNVGAVEAYSSIIDKLTPQQRIPGSGATSDYEGRMFKNSLPKLINTAEGNAIIENTLASLSQHKLDRAAIAERALTREITPAEALKQIRELPNPYDNFKKFKESGFKADPNNPGSATSPAAVPGAAPASPAAPRVVPTTKADIDASLTNARAAIAANPAARAGVVRKLQDAGIDASGL